MYIFSGGPSDEASPPSHQEATKEYYEYFGGKVEMVTRDIGHSMASPFHTNDAYPKDYDTVGAMMTHLLTNLKENPVSSVAPGDTDWMSKGVLKQFFQDEFLDTSIFQNA